MSTTFSVRIAYICVANPYNPHIVLGKEPARKKEGQKKEERERSVVIRLPAMWKMPGGKCDTKDESLVAAACREWREETGTELTPRQLADEFALDFRQNGNIERLYLVLTKRPLKRFTPGAGIVCVRWFPFCQIPKAKTGGLAYSHRQNLKILLSVYQNLLWFAGVPDDEIQRMIRHLP